MRQFGLALLTFMLLAFGAHAQAPRKTFADEGLASDFTRLEERIKKENASVSPTKGPADLARDAAQLAQRGRHRDALRPLGAALVATPRDSALWLSYARTAFSAGINSNDSAAYTLREDAAAAAYGAYLRAANATDEAGALAYLGEMFVKRVR